MLTQNIKTWIEIRNKATQEVLFPKTEFLAEGGVLEFSFTYPKTGLHELFVGFEKQDEPGKIYTTEGFLVDVREAKTSQSVGRNSMISVFVASLIAFFFGVSAGRLLKTRLGK